MTEELRPCPFCGNKEPTILSAVGESWVLCETCKATTEAHTDRRKAIEAWNRRASDGMPLGKYLAKVAHALATDAAYNMEGADGDTFNDMNELYAISASLRRLAERIEANNA